MTDFTQQFAESLADEQNAKSPLAIEYDNSVKADKAAEDKRIDGKFQSAYDQSDLPVAGPSMDKYDYRKDFDEGNNFKPGPDGGIQINNRNYKEKEINVGGYDFASGKKYQNKYEDANGNIRKGIEQLRKEDSNTATGPSYKNVDGLHSVAKGIMSEGGTFDDFMENAKGPWAADQMAIAWQSANTTKRTMDDIESKGKRWFDEYPSPPEGEQTRGGLTLPEEPYTEETLATDKNWLDGGRKFLAHFRGETALTMQDGEVDKALKATMGLNKWNLPLMMYFANEITDANDPELAISFVNLMDQYDHLEFNMEGTGRAFAGLLSDPVTYLTLGGGIVVTRMAAMATKEGIKNAMRAIAYGTAYDVASGAVEGAVMNKTGQEVEVAAGLREEVDTGEVIAAGGITGLVTGMIGTPLNIVTDKTARGVAAGKAKMAYDWLKDVDLSSPPSGSLAAQRGSLDLRPKAQVELVSRLQEWIESEVADGAKPITIRQKIKEGINKGIIKPQEVKWSGIEKLLDEAEARGVSGMSKFRMQRALEYQTPQPKIVAVEIPHYQQYSLLTSRADSVDRPVNFDANRAQDSVTGYRERMIVISGKDQRKPQTMIDAGVELDRRWGMKENKYRPGHLKQAQGEQLSFTDDMIAHSRVENAELGGKKGKMVLEVQSDYHKAGQTGGYNDAVPKDIHDMPYYPKVFETAKEYDIDVNEKNAIAKVWPFLDDEIKTKIMNDMPSPQPYGKDWDTMAMRLEIMDSINNGDEFIAWPATADQIDVIEQWGGPDVFTDEGIVKRATEHRVKNLKKMGFEVEQVDMPQYKELGKLSDDLSGLDLDAALDDALSHRNQVMFYKSNDDGTQTFYLVANPDEISYHDLSINSVDELKNMEILRTLNEDDYVDFQTNILYDGKSNTGLQDTTFNIIRLTKEVKEKFRKEGMQAYSLGAAPVAGMQDKKEKSKPKRDANGRFTK